MLKSTNFLFCCLLLTIDRCGQVNVKMFLMLMLKLKLYFHRQFFLISFSKVYTNASLLQIEFGREVEFYFNTFAFFTCNFDF
jgi:hypothetical protein